MKKTISAIIINYNTPEMTVKAIGAFVDNSSGFNYEIILIDNNSSEKIGEEALRKWPVKYIQNSENAGFARAVNQGIAVSGGDYILLLNSDALVEKDTIKSLLEYLENHSRAGIIGPKFIYPDGKNQSSSGRFPNLWREFFRFSMLHKVLPFSTLNKDFHTVKPVNWLSGGCLLFKREVINQIGVLDDHYFFGTEDMDFCLRADKQGWQVIYYPLVKIIHYHKFSSGGRRSTRALKMERDAIDYFFKKNFSNKIITRILVYQMHNLKMFALSLLGYK